GFNTAISQMMIFINECYKAEKVNRDMIVSFIKILSPIAPHVCEEIYQHYTGADTIAYEAWPSYSEEALEKRMVEIAVQVNGKVRGKLSVAMDTPQEELEKQALALESVQNFIAGKQIRKVIAIVNRIVNIVAK
ncbi:class I tRNA ligase family protein, partial [Vibrio sp. FNV 38]|nr:class I tRNA ligase family protein [Vibrio sp. FNV 38]